MILSRAFDLAFNSEVTCVPVLQSLSQQITNCVQIANSIIWESLKQVLYLRAGNANVTAESAKEGQVAIVTNMSSAATVASVESKMTRTATGIIKNPFMHRGIKFYENDDDWDTQSFDAITLASSLFSKASSVSSVSKSAAGGTANPEQLKRMTRMLIPLNILEGELDLEQDEHRCLEENTTGTIRDWEYWRLPRYQDHVLALQILVESLRKLSRLDDVERTLFRINKSSSIFGNVESSNLSTTRSVSIAK